MRVRSLTAVLAASLALPLAAQGPESGHAGHTAAGGSPAGWSVRADGKADASRARVETMGKGLHVTTGPAVILYRGDTGGSGPFHTLASFTQTKASAHPEGYGLLFGGKGLEGADQQYVYFLVRQDGSYLIKRRNGQKTMDISKGWVAHPAVKQPKGNGSATNLLEVDNKVDPAKVTFKVNGQDVHTMEAAGLDLSGTVGLRVNHNLDLHVEGFDVHR